LVPCSSMRFLWILVWIFAGAHLGVILESPDQKG
jgi:hypothetical protein